MKKKAAPKRTVKKRSMSKAEWNEAILWVAAHLDDEEAAGDPPSVTAKSLAGWAKESTANKGKFYTTMLKDVAKGADDKHDDGEGLSDQQHMKDLYEKLKLKDHTVCGTCRQEIALNCPHCGTPLRFPQ